jgi:hypothetical protein
MQRRPCLPNTFMMLLGQSFASCCSQTTLAQSSQQPSQLAKWQYPIEPLRGSFNAIYLHEAPGPIFCQLLLQPRQQLTTLRTQACHGAAAAPSRHKRATQQQLLLLLLAAWGTP